MEESSKTAMDEAMSMLAVYGLDVVGALIILIAGWIIAGWAKSATARALGRSQRMDTTLIPFLSSIVRYLILIIVAVAVLGQFGIETASIIAVLGTAGLAVGLAMQGTLSHFAAGVVLLILRPFKVGDTIEANGQIATVQEIGIFATIQKTADGIFVYVPNGQLLGAALKNFSRNPTRRIDIVVGIAYEADVEEGLAVAQKVLDLDDRILKDPAAQCMVVALADSSVNINMRCWVQASDYWPVSFDINKKIKQELDAAGISIPYPQRDVHMIESNND